VRLRLAAAVVALSSFAAAPVSAQVPKWQVLARVETQPLAAGQCAWVSIDVRLPSGKLIPLPDGSGSVGAAQVELTLLGAAATQFKWARNTPGSYNLCAVTTDSAEGQILVRYPRSDADKKQTLPNVAFESLLRVRAGGDGDGATAPWDTLLLAPPGAAKPGRPAAAVPLATPSIVSPRPLPAIARPASPPAASASSAQTGQQDGWSGWGTEFSGSWNAPTPPHEPIFDGNPRPSWTVDRWCTRLYPDIGAAAYEVTGLFFGTMLTSMPRAVSFVSDPTVMAPVTGACAWSGYDNFTGALASFEIRFYVISSTHFAERGAPSGWSIDAVLDELFKHASAYLVQNVDRITTTDAATWGNLLGAWYIRGIDPQRPDRRALAQMVVLKPDAATLLIIEGSGVPKAGTALDQQRVTDDIARIAATLLKRYRLVPPSLR
jgi:hypothetical protein